MKTYCKYFPPIYRYPYVMGILQKCENESPVVQALTLENAIYNVKYFNYGIEKCAQTNRFAENMTILQDGNTTISTNRKFLTLCAFIIFLKTVLSVFTGNTLQRIRLSAHSDIERR